METLDMLYLRPATMDDANDLLAWRNDPETCANSRQTSPIPRKRHGVWMSVNVQFGFPTRVVLIAETGDSIPVGVIDFQARDKEMKIFEIGITIAPGVRGHGYGHTALALACKKMKDKTLKAEIRSENRASRRIFRKCGFLLMSEADGFAQFRREKNDRTD